jgi:hypothetical protein
MVGECVAGNWECGISQIAKFEFPMGVGRGFGRWVVVDQVESRLIRVNPGLEVEWGPSLARISRMGGVGKGSVSVRGM